MNEKRICELLEQRIAELEAQVAMLREALAPIAEIRNKYPEWMWEYGADLWWVVDDEKRKYQKLTHVPSIHIAKAHDVMKATAKTKGK